jgi:hypothetical protein
MNLKQLSAAFLLCIFSLTLVHAAGQPVNEDLALLYELSQDMIELSREKDVEGFMKIVNPALRLTAENLNNSMALPRVSAKLRAAKYAVKAGKFTSAVKALEQAQRIMQKKRVLAWDGGAE